MSYIIQTIVPYNISGTFKRNGIDYQFHFTHSIPNVGHLYVLGSSGAANAENLYVLPSLINRDFRSVFEKINQVYDGNDGIRPTLTQYQILITGSKGQVSPLEQTRYINVYFTNSFKKVVLNNGREIEIKEGNIIDFLQNINNYTLE